jgi:long-chain fatty acid transport protein
MGWSSFQEVAIDFTGGTLGGSGNALPDTTIREEWEDANNYRVGLRWSASPTTQWRFGYVFDETPQPEEAVSPLLPDADRNGFTIGFGHNGPGLGFDVALMYLPFDERTRDQSFATGPGEAPDPTFFGTYNTTAYLLGVTVNW